MTKRIISLLLCLPMLLSVMAPAVFATGNDNVIVIDDTITLSNVTIDGDVNDFIYVENSENTEDQPQETEPARIPEPEQETEPAVTEPAVTEPVAAKPVETEPVVMKPVQLIGEATATTEDGTTVSVAGIPKGGSVTVAPSMYGQVSTFAVRRSSPETMIFAWDISVQDAEGADWQPEGTVQVEVDVPGVKLHKYTEVYVMHIDDEGNESRIEAEVTEDGKVAFETDGFSTFAGFTVDFAYEGTQFSINGLDSILLSELMDKLNMPLYIEDVADVTFTNEELVKIEKVEGDWNLISVESFTTEEKLTITTKDGKTYVIDVTDPAYAGFYAITNEGGWYNGNGRSEDLSGGDGVITILLDGDGCPQINGDSTNSWMTDEKRFVVDGGGILYIELQHADLYGTGATTSSVNNLIWDLMQIRVTGGSTLVIRLGGSFEGDETITLRYKKNDNGGFGEVFPMFDVDNGNLLIRVNDVSKLPTDLGVASSKGSFFSVQNDDWTDNGKNYIPMIIDGQNFATNIQPGAMKDHPLILLRSSSGTARHAFIEDVEFKNAKFRAIRCYANEMANLQVKDCVFGNTVQVHHSGSENGGAAINIEAEQLFQGVTVTRTDITKFVVDHCKFDGVNANDDGGAIENNARIAETEIKNCKFLNISTTQKSAAGEDIYAANGGAIAFKGYMGKILIDSCEFNNVKVKEYGGAVYFENFKNTDNNWSKFNEVTFQNCDFIDCISKKQHGGAIAVKSQVHTMKILGCKFERCKSLANGGAISFNAKAMTDFNSWQESFTGYGANNTATYTWTTNGAKCSTINTILIDAYNGKQTQFIDCKASTSGGAIEFSQNCYVKTADINNTLIQGCKAVNNGSAIFMSSPVVESLDLNTVTVTECDYLRLVPDGNGSYKKDSDGQYVDDPDDPNAVCIHPDASGTIRSTGATTCILTMDNCTMTNNYSYSNGGGLYWNACYTRGILEKCEATVKNSTFSGNYAEGYGGGIYCESNLIVTNCIINNNYAKHYGGGIAQQVYSNSGRMLQAGEQTNMTVNGGTQIYDNYSDQYGGGISVRANPTQSIQAENANVGHAVILNVNGATIRNNTAKEHGGGIFFQEERDRVGYYDTDENGKNIVIPDAESIANNNAELDTYTKSITIANAEIYENRAGIAVEWNSAEKTETNNAGHGGGVFMNSSNQTTLNISSGNIYKNLAQQGNGGGIYMDGENAVLTITGGTIGGSDANKNEATVANGVTSGNGGGIAISGGATIEMKKVEGAEAGGTISYNKAANDGGGIWLNERGSNNVANKITINEGTVAYNNAGNDGGGISMKYRAEATLNGGNVSNNTATRNGGGLDVYYYAVLKVSGGTIENNTAVNGNGGGAHCLYYGTATIEKGSTIKGNKALKAAGGGVFARLFTVTISGGEILNNQAKNGAGVCIVSTPANGYITTISGGSIHNNTASSNGGGLFNQGCAHVTVEGGNIYSNSAVNGGGVYAEAGGTTTVSATETTAADIYSNTASSLGGGVYVNGSNFNMTGGKIEKNSANSGGGINAESNSTVTIKGGSIYKNTAGIDGGGIQIYNSATLNVKGGNIEENTANGNGGGIIVKNNSTATFVKEGDSVGFVVTNTAKNGGGVYVIGSSKLTFQEGYVVSNKAIGMPQNLATAYQNAEMLAGTGGGVFVADGTSTAKSEFAMTGTTDMGIYNNEASFAADDVYANNNNTKVVVPAVAKMNLSQYVGNPIGWFEDYATNDAQYDHDTALKFGTAMGIKSGYVFRYRKSPVEKRVQVQFTGDQLTLQNKFVCMTLGVPTAVDDTVVIDYGLPVNIDVRANDLGMNEDVLEPGLVVSIGPAGGYTNSMTDTLNEGYTAEGSTTSKDVLVDGVRFGIANRVNDSTVCYTPTTMNVNKMATFTYALKYANKYFYANVNILPATSVYFEDSFTTDGNTPADNNSNRYMTFSGTGEWTQVGTTITDLLQTESRPGDGVKSDHIYGYDGAYDSKEMATYSMGSAMKAHVDEGEVASASFTFTGTGFDVISLTNSQTGTILVKVSQGDTVVKTYMVDTYYGYSYKYYKTTFTFTGGKWVPSTVEIPKKQMGISEKQPDGHPDEGDSYVVYSEGWAPTPGTTSLYQIPVIKADLVNYGTYNVEIKVAYSASFDHGQYADKGCDFYLDAIRIYNPMQNDKTANDTYVQDAENFPMYYELRNMLISANTFNGLNGEITGGAVFIDKNQSVAFPDDIGVADYINYGPNNEVYLGGFQAIAFNLAQSGDVASIQIGVKAPLTTGTNNYAWMKYGRAAGDKEKVVYSGTDLYVDITELNNGVVVIQNQANSVLAITNIKVTYNTAPVSAEPLNIFVDEASVNAVLKSLRRGAAAEQKPVLTASGATLSLESEILMNLYFQATNADQISTDDMGLLVWNQNPGAADFATADSVIPGALYDEAKGVYMVHSEGISGKKMGDSLYLAAYAKCADGSYVYTEPMEYSPKIYAMNRLAASQNENLKALLVAMLNYGAEAQTFFNYNADQLMNADLTAEQKALVKAYEASMMESPAAVDAAKAGTFGTETKGFANVGATMSAEGIFSINYYFTTANAVDQVTMYYWTKDAYDAADVLTADNASGSKVMTATSTENQVFASIDGIAAKDLDKTVYVCGVYEVDGETFTTGIIRYSLGVYCVNKAANGSEAMKPLAAATAVYGYYAKVYFN